MTSRVERRRFLARCVARAGGACLLLLSASAPACAAGDGEPDVHVGMAVDYELFAGPRSPAEAATDTRNAITFIPKVDWTPNTVLSMRLSGLLRKDFSDEERSRADVYDSFVRIERERWSLQGGRQFITWGRADTLRPTDVFKRHDILDLIENREEPTDALKLDVVHGSSTLEGVWAPVFEPDIYSLRPDNPWSVLPRRGVVPDIGLVALSYREDRTVPPATMASERAGARWSGTFRGWDVAGMYYYGYDRIPTTVGQQVTTLAPLAAEATVTLSPIHERIHVVGGDTATVVSGWGLRAEAAYTLTSDEARDAISGNDPYFRFTGGLDRTFSQIPIGESLSFLMQYSLDTARPQPEQTGTQAVNPLLHPFRHALVSHSIWTWTAFRRLSVKAYVNLEDGDHVIQSEFSWQPADAWTLVVGGDVLGGGVETFFGRFRNNDRLRVRLSYAL